MFLSPVRVAHMYFELEMTQQQIASELGVSRMRISRMLQQARTDGTVTISIRYGGFFPELEDAIAAKFPGVRAIVADGMEGSVPAIREALAVTAADYLAGELQGGSRVAVGWGSTVRRIADRLTGTEPDAVFVPMIGGQGHAALDLHSTQISFALARAVSGQSRSLLAPAVVRSVEERSAIVANPEVHAVLAEAAAADLALFSVGAPFSPTSTLESAGYFSAEDLELLRAEDARCDVVSLAYLDSRGEPSAASLSERSVAITQAQLRNIPQRVCVAGGADKSEAIGLALAAGFVTVLITDDATARLLAG